jgi:hypothetical protein
VWGGIIASPEKATKVNQTIVITVTVPAECEFVSRVLICMEMRCPMGQQHQLSIRR